MPPPAAVPKGAALAKLEGRIFLADTDVKFDYFMVADNIVLGRSDPAHVLKRPLTPAQDGIDIGLGDSSKLSRAHARIHHDPATRAFLLHCQGKNGITVTLPSTGATVVMTPDTAPVALQSRTLVQMGDAVFCFLLPAEYPPQAKKRREWIKAENASLRTLMMRLGYGRWNDIIRIAPGRLSEREPDELVPVARRFVARCFIHARPGVEQKVLSEILREHFAPDVPEAEVNADVDALLAEAKQLAEPNEKRKFVRWARKLRLLRRLRDIHDHSSLERLRQGKLRVYTPRPAPYWSTQDDVDLIAGCYRHGYGATEALRTDETLGFHDRYLPSVSARRSSAAADNTAKQRTSLGAAAGAVGNAEDEEDHEDDDDPEEEEEDADRDSAAGDNNTKKQADDAAMSSPSANDESTNAAPQVTGNGKSTTACATVKSEGTVLSKVSGKSEPIMEHTVVTGTAAAAAVDVKLEEAMEANGDDDKSALKPAIVPKDKMVPFPTSEALMKRLKSIINACAKEYDRDMREQRKQTQAQNRAQQRKNDLAARKAEKAAQKIRQREERRVAKSQPFSKKDANEFEKALTNFGLEYVGDDPPMPDWKTFLKKAPSLATKYVETMEEAFEDFTKEAHRLVDLAAAKEDEDTERLEQLMMEKPSKLFTQLTLERAERVLDRLRFFRTLRSEILTNPGMSTILRGCKRTRELPLWWRSMHDKALLCGVNYHGFNAWDALAKDEDLPFAMSIKGHEEKFANDSKNLRKGAFPKPSAALKRAKSLVSYFRQRAEDPHYQQQIREANGNSFETKIGVNGHGEKRDSEQSDSESGEKAEPKEETATVGVTSMQVGEGWEQENVEKVQVELHRSTILNIVDESGRLSVPANLGNGLFLLELGSIVSYLSTFHSATALYPVGYRAVRQMSRFTFLCEILKSDDGAHPVFRVSELEGFQTHDDKRPMWCGCGNMREATDIEKTWMAVVKADMLNSEERLKSAHEQFGLFEPTVIHFMQQLPGARQCAGYVFRDVDSENRGTVDGAHEVGILAAMTDALSKSRKRNVNSVAEEMQIPDIWKKRRKSHEREW